MSEMRVAVVLRTSKTYQRLNVEFSKRAILHPVRAKEVKFWNQIDLVIMTGNEISYKGRTRRYVMSVVEVFNVEIYRENGPPRVSQSDQSTEFRGEIGQLMFGLNLNNNDYPK